MSVGSTLRRRPATAVPAIALAGLALMAAGCGNQDGEEEGGDTGAREERPAGGGARGATTINQTATDFDFDPANPSAKSGKVTVKLTNEGQAPHAIEIEDVRGKDVESETIQPGENTTLTVNLEPGTYEFYCPVGNHRELGMTGELTVR